MRGEEGERLGGRASGGGDLAAGPQQRVLQQEGEVSREQAEEGLPSPGHALIQHMVSHELWAPSLVPGWFLAVALR